MAAETNASEEFDLQSLRAFKEYLICSCCSRFPRPKTNIYSCPKCYKIYCHTCNSTNVKCGLFEENSKNRSESAKEKWRQALERIQNTEDSEVLTKKEKTKFKPPSGIDNVIVCNSPELGKVNTRYMVNNSQ